MMLYCYACAALHDVVPAEVEWLVYALQVAEADAAKGQRVDVKREPEEGLACLAAMLQTTRGDGYYKEWVADIVMFGAVQQAALEERPSAESAEQRRIEWLTNAHSGLR